MIDYLILPEHQLILVWNQGETSVQECIENTLKIREEPDHSPGFDVITDVTELKTDFSSQDIQRMVDHSMCFHTGRRSKRNAIVAPSDRTYGMCRMYQQLADGITPFKTAVFRDWASALVWLKKDPATLAKYMKVG